MTPEEVERDSLESIQNFYRLTADPMSVEDLAYRLIRVFEGERLTAYWDGHGKVWTIGLGHTGPDVHQGLTITREQSLELFRRDVAPLLKMTAAFPVVQAAALVSFGYNCGVGALERILTHHTLHVVHDGFLTDDGKLYGRVSGGEAVEGLDARRKLEAALYLAGCLVKS